MKKEFVFKALDPAVIRCAVIAEDINKAKKILKDNCPYFKYVGEPKEENIK